MGRRRHLFRNRANARSPDPVPYLLTLGLLLWPLAAKGQDHRDAVEGHRLAAAWCSNCHHVEATPPKTANDAVPAFTAIAAMPSTTVLSLRAFLQTPHVVMPDFRLTDDQIGDVSTYILSLRRR